MNYVLVAPPLMAKPVGRFHFLGALRATSDLMLEEILKSLTHIFYSLSICRLFLRNNEAVLFLTHWRTYAASQNCWLKIWETAASSGSKLVMQALCPLYPHAPKGSLMFFSSDWHQVGQTAGAPDYWRRLLLLMLCTLSGKTIIHTTCLLCCFLLVNPQLTLHVGNLASSPDCWLEWAVCGFGLKEAWFSYKTAKLKNWKMWRRKDHQVALCVHVLGSFPTFFSIFVFKSLWKRRHSVKIKSVPPARPPPEQLNNVSVFNEAMQNLTFILWIFWEPSSAG